MLLKDFDPKPMLLARNWRRVFPLLGYPGQGRWEIYGMELPDGVLEKVYHKNADKIFAQFKGWH